MLRSMSMNEYPISDLGAAAYLVTIGSNLIRLDRENPRRIQFVFEHSHDLERAVEDYWNGSARVAPLSLQQSQKTLKSRIYADQSR